MAFLILHPHLLRSGVTDISHYTQLTAALGIVSPVLCAWILRGKCCVLSTKLCVGVGVGVGGMSHKRLKLFHPLKYSFLSFSNLQYCLG